jgi:hypothetical protein
MCRDGRQRRFLHGAAESLTLLRWHNSHRPNSPIRGSRVLTDQQVTFLKTGLMYINIHSEAHPNGEIRGQVLIDPSSSAFDGRGTVLLAGVVLSSVAIIAMVLLGGFAYWHHRRTTYTLVCVGARQGLYVSDALGSRLSLVLVDRSVLRNNVATDARCWLVGTVLVNTIKYFSCLVVVCCCSSSHHIHLLPVTVE